MQEHRDRLPHLLTLRSDSKLEKLLLYGLGYPAARAGYAGYPIDALLRFAWNNSRNHLPSDISIDPELRLGDAYFFSRRTWDMNSPQSVLVATCDRFPLVAMSGLVGRHWGFLSSPKTRARNRDSSRGPVRFLLTLCFVQSCKWRCGGGILARLCWECALREFLEGFTVGMAMLGVMLVLTALADKLL